MHGNNNFTFENGGTMEKLTLRFFEEFCCTFWYFLCGCSCNKCGSLNKANLSLSGYEKFAM